MKQKVLFFISSLEGGGAERVIVDILRYIDKNRICPVLVLLYPFENSPYKEYLSKNVRIIIIKRKSNSFFEQIKQFIAFVKTVYRERPQLILSMLTHNNIMAILAGMLFKINVIASEHNILGEVIKTKEGKRMLGLSTAILVRLLYRYADMIVAVSEEIKKNLIEEFKTSSEKIKVIYNPVDMERITELGNVSVKHPFFIDNVPIIIGMGRLARQKGFNVLIKAFSRVVREMDARLIILGEGAERETLEEFTTELALADKISFPGFQKNPYPFLSNADIFVLSSRYEGLPMAVLEAMACGVPVVATDCKSGPREILQDGKYGLLVPVEDEVALSEGILKLLKDKSLRENFSALSKERAMDFSVGKIVKKYEELILS